MVAPLGGSNLIQAKLIREFMKREKIKGESISFIRHEKKNILWEKDSFDVNVTISPTTDQRKISKS
jgi:hypothetical protein